MSINDLQLSRICVSLQSEEKGRRKKALQELYSSLFENLPEISAEEFLKIWEIINKQLARMLTDEMEFCRNLSVELWKKFLEILPISEKNIVYLIPILSRRLSFQELLETSEEVRLNYVKLLRLVVEKYKKNLAIYYEDFLAITSRVVTDNYPEIKRESCQLIEELAKSLPEQFYSRSENLVKPILSNFTHQHWKVRVASVKAIGQVLLHGKSKSMEEIATPMAEKLFDQSAAVRLAVIEVAGLWLLELRDRYSWWHKLLPLLVTGLHDEIENIRNRAGQLWEKTGELYMTENESDDKFKDKMDFLIDDPPHYPPNVKRPNLGCRVIVQQNLCKLVAGISRELGDWLPDIRVRSAQLLCVLVLNAEADVTQNIEKLLPAMYRACNDEDFRIVTNVELAAEYMGYFVPPSVYCNLVLPTLEDTITAGHLRVFAAIIRGSESQSLRPKLPEIGNFLQQSHVCRSKKPRYQEQLGRCCESIIKVCKKDCTEISQELFTVLFTLFSTAQEDSTLLSAENLLQDLARYEELSTLEELFISHLRLILIDVKDSCDVWTIYSHELQIFHTCLTRAALATSKNSDLVLPILKSTMSNESDPELRLKLFILLADFFKRKNITMRFLDDMENFWDSIFKDVIFPGLIWSAGRSAEAIRTAAICCLCALLDEETPEIEKNKDGERKIDEKIKNDKLGERNEQGKLTKIEGEKLEREEEEKMGKDDEENIQEIEKEKLEMDEKTKLDKIELFTKIANFSAIFGKLVPILVSLVDDNAKKSRLYALRAISLIVEIAKKNSFVNDEQIHGIYPTVLKRLDDGCDDVRIAAIEALVIIWAARPENYDINFSRSHIDFLYTTAIVHLDDPDAKFQSLMLDALVELGKVHPEFLAKKIENCKGNFRNQAGLDKLLKNCYDLLRETK